MTINTITADATTPDSDRDRFGFGENWSRFLGDLSDLRIAEAERSLRELLDVPSLEGKTFLDVGCGSGLFSLAARRLGARVHSFDYDPQSVACAAELRNRCLAGDPDWQVEQGSVLDPAYLASLGKFDVVYSWGVLHHTGNMWQALQNVGALVAEKGHLAVAIYNDQGRTSRYWKGVKRTYNRLPDPLRFLVLWPAFARVWGPTTIRDMIRRQPFRTWREYYTQRGMSPWRDVVDWVGGYPFEVATPDAIVHFYRAREFELTNLITVGQGSGCNEFVLQRTGGKGETLI